MTLKIIYEKGFTAMISYRIKNLHSNMYLDCGTENWSTLTSGTTTTQVVLANNDGSKSQVWVIDGISGNIFVRTCLDVNFGLTRFENRITHQCGITNVVYYNNMANNPFSPKIQLLSTDGGLRIKLVDSNMYLTHDVFSNNALWGGYVDSGSDKTKQTWVLERATDITPTTLPIPQNSNQNNSNYPDKACAMCCVADIGAFYHKGAYTYQDMIDDGVIVLSSSSVQRYNNCRYCNFGNEDNSPTFAKIKAQLDISRPVYLNIGLGEKFKHYIVAYGYLNSCSSTSDVLVLDPNNNVESRDMGIYSTLAQAITHNDATNLTMMATTSPKA